MIVAERRPKVAVSKMDHFGEVMSDGRLTVPSSGKIYSLREAIMHSKKLGRPLTEAEMKRFEK